MKKLRLSLLLLSLGLPGFAETVVDLYTPLVSQGGYMVSSGQSVASTWAVSSVFQNVTVAAPLFTPYPDSPQTGTAYLANSVTPGTVLSAPFSFPKTGLSDPRAPYYDSAYVTLFSNLTLTPGTYYLTLTAPGSLGDWTFAQMPVLAQMAPGVTVGSTYLQVGGSSAYQGPQISAFSFLDTGAFGRVGFKVYTDGTGGLTTGDPATTPTPEPPTYALFFGIVLAGVVVLRWNNTLPASRNC